MLFLNTEGVSICLGVRNVVKVMQLSQHVCFLYFSNGFVFLHRQHFSWL